ncbi:MAG TPA: rod-binding protein [Hyphomicrobiales bacterium]|nr:rod-binding protein [Hyphomicrobiales bacterium]
MNGIAANSDMAMVYTDLGSLQALKAKSREQPDQALAEVARQFESLFTSMLLKSMRATLPQDGLMQSGDLSTYQDMFDQQLALDLSRRGGLGLAPLIERQLGMLAAVDPAGDEGAAP